MPISKLDKIGSNAHWCLWEITETTDELRRKLVLSESDEAELQHISHIKKQKEHLASRHCVQEIIKVLGKEYKGIVKDDHDKPFLIDLNFHVSISHSFPYAVAILHKKLRVGIDIEKPVEKLGRIAHRFLNEEEFHDSGGDLKKLCVYWSGKESIFKLNGRRGLNFKKDIRIYPFNLVKRDVIRSQFMINDSPVKVALNYRELKGHIISYCF